MKTWHPRLGWAGAGEKRKHPRKANQEPRSGEAQKELGGQMVTVTAWEGEVPWTWLCHMSWDSINATFQPQGTSLALLSACPLPGEQDTLPTPSCWLGERSREQIIKTH